MATSLSAPILTGPPIFDTLPVCRVGHLCGGSRFQPGRRLAPLTLLQACWAQGAVQLRLSCFETSPAPHSTFYLLLTPHPRQPRRFLSLRFGPGSSATRLHGLDQGAAPPLSRSILLWRDGGEHQEGVFWGGRVSIPQRVLSQLSPGFSPSPGAQLGLSLFKFCPTAPAYCLSLFPDAGSHRGVLLLC